METKDQALDKAVQMAKNVSRGIVESGQEHKPILIVFTPTEIINTLIPWMDKENFKDAISQLLRHFNAYAYVFINEAWTTKLDKDSPLLQELMSGRKKISELPPDDRMEVVIITAVENGKSCRLWSAKIQYTPDDKRYLSEWKEADGVGSGRMFLKEW